jgi:hypothetical protein
MTPRIIVVVVAGLLVQQLAAQDRSIGFVQLEVPAIPAEISSTKVPEAADYLANSTAFGIAILEANRLELQHRLDFMVLAVDFSSFKADPAIAAKDLARSLRASTVHRIFLLAGPCLKSPPTRRDYGRFLAALQKELPRHSVADLTGKAATAGDFTLIGLDTALLDSSPSLRERELARAAGTTERTAASLVFASVESLPKPPIEAQSLWDSKEWRRLVGDARVGGIFVSALGDIPQNGPTFPAPGRNMPENKLHFIPRLSSAARSPARGILFVRSARNAHVTSEPIWISWNGAGFRDQQNVAIEGELKEKNKEYEEAYSKYREAMKSKDPHIQAQAEAGLRRTDEALQSPWESWKRRSEIVKALAERWRDLLIAGAVVAILILIPIWRYLAHGAARVELAKKLSDDAPAELLMFYIIDAAKVIRQSSGTWNRVPAGLQTPKSEIDVDMAPDTARKIADELGEIEVPGLDLKTVTKFLKWILSVWSYFSWQLEISLWGTEPQCVVYARLRFGWRTEGAWMEPTSATGAMALSAAAWQLVCDVIGSGVEIR